MQLSLPIDQRTPFEQPLSIPTEPTSVPSEATSFNRGQKAFLGLGQITNMSQDDMTSAIASGKEPAVRNRASLLIDQHNMIQRTKAFQQGLLQNVPAEDLAKILPSYNQNPDTVIEEGFANHVINPLINRKDPFSNITQMQDVQETMPEFLHRASMLATDLSTRTQVYQNMMTDLEQEYQHQSWFSWGVDELKEAFQPFVEYKLRGLTEQSSAFANVFLGENLRQEADDINALPNEQAIPKLKAILATLDPTMKIKFMHYVMGSTNTDRIWDNAMTGLMGAGAATSVAKKGLYALRAAKQATQAVEDAKKIEPVVEGKFLPDVNTVNEEVRWGDEGPENISPREAKAAAAGDLQEQAIDKLKQPNPSPTQRAREALPTVMQDVHKSNRLNRGNSGAEIVNRIGENLKSLSDTLVSVIEGSIRPNALIDVSNDEIAARLVANWQKDKYPGLAGNVINVENIFHDPYSNSYFTYLVLGQNDASFFKSEGEAIAWAKENNIPISFIHEAGGGKRATDVALGHEIVHQEGKGWNVALEVPVREDEPLLKQLQGRTTASQVRERPGLFGWLGQYMSWIRTPEETSALNQRINRYHATYGAEKYYAALAEHQQSIRKLSRGQANDFERVLRAGQEAVDSNGDKGHFFNLGQLDDVYQRLFHRLPEDNEREAYMQFRGAVEADRYFRTMAKMRAKTSAGGEEHIVSTIGKDGKMENSPAFEAARVPPNPETKKIMSPGGDHNVIAIFRNKTSQTKLFDSSSAEYARIRKKLDDDLQTGKATALEILEKNLDPLAGHAGITKGSNVRYVIAYNDKASPLDWMKQIPVRGGGHLEQETEHYISQAGVHFNPITKRFHYKGDTNLYGTNYFGQGSIAAKRFDDVRQLIAKGDEAGARKLAEDPATAIPISYDDFRKEFSAHGDQPARLSKDEPIQLRPKDKTLMDMGKDALENRYTQGGVSILRNDTKEGILRNKVVQFTGERDAYDFYQVQDKGTKFNPLFQLEPGKVVDAVPMMNRALGRIINSLWMDDYKTSAVEHWLFGKSVFNPNTGKLENGLNWLDVDPKEVAHSPFYYFNNAEQHFKAGIPQAVKSDLLASKMKIRQFIGTPSSVDTFLYSLEQKLSDSIYGKFGPKAMKLEPLWKVSALSNVPVVMRSIIYNTKMGFFSPRQFLIHAFTFVNAALIAPKYAGVGAFGGMLHLWSWLHAGEDVLAHMDELATKMGWRPGEFLEARKGLIRTNFLPVEKNTLALTDNPMANRLVKNKMSSFLDLGTTPFRGGVKSLKASTWYMAYKEYRDLHPTGPLNDYDWGKILVRADDFAHNMSRASTSSVQKGINTFGAMFSSYNLRVLELLTGKRLSIAEKSRLFLGYATLFGVPTAGGVFGLSTLLRTQVQKGNVPGLETYVPGHDPYSTFIMEGGLSTALAWAIGGGDVQKGTVYNVGESYGAKDLETWERNLSGENSLWQVFGGAAASMASSAWAASADFRSWGSSMFKDPSEQGSYHVTMDSVVNFMKEISSVNYATRTYLALETGKWVSRNNAYLENVTPNDSIFRGISGLQSTDVSLLYPSSLIAKENAQAVTDVKKLLGREMQRYFNAMDLHNESAAKTFQDNIYFYMQSLPAQERGAAMAQAYRDNQPLVDRIQFLNVTSKDIPDDDRGRRQEIQQKIDELKAKQGVQ